MKMRQSVRRRGQPLLALLMLMVSWVGARAAMWETPRIVASHKDGPKAPVAPPREQSKSVEPSAPRIVPARSRPDTPLELPRTSLSDPPETAPVRLIITTPSDDAEPREAVHPPMLSAQDAADHQELYAIGMNMPTIEEAVAIDVPRSARLPSAAALAQAEGSRWSGDAWLLLREGGNGFNAPGAGLPGVVVPVGFYGGSQAGAVLRYRLAPSSPHRPALYLRAASGLQYPRGEEVAAGFSIRPIAGVPVSVMAEGRATRTITSTRIRPAVALVTELPAARLPLGARGEAYVQAGYVGGAGSTAFVDGQARIEKPVIRTGRFELRAGGGVWGGAQRGARRVDIGPTATLAVPVGPVGARLSADYRIRVAGQAAPGSGAVLTLSAGF